MPVNMKIWMLYFIRAIYFFKIIYHLGVIWIFKKLFSVEDTQVYKVVYENEIL